MVRKVVLLIVIVLFGFFELTAYDFKKITVIGTTDTHPVIRSLLAGFRQAGIVHNFNAWHDLGDCVCVISDIGFLRRAIELKKRGKIKTLIAGPNLVVRAIDDGGLIGSAEIDYYLVNSDWTYASYLEDLPSLKNRLGIWFAGIDENDWSPVQVVKNRDVIVYWKTETENFCIEIENIVRKYKFNPIRLRYGSYNKEQYKNLLNRALFALFISRSESQGIALLESWAMNVPTLVWDPKELHAHGKIYSQVSAAPYLSAMTGKDFKTLQELESVLSEIDYLLAEWSPRNWVCQHMTDWYSGQCLLDIIKKI